MTIDEISDFVVSLGEVLTVSPGPGDGTREIAWGDRFFYYAPDGVVPPGQPFATIVTKGYPGEPSSGLGDGIFRFWPSLPQAMRSPSVVWSLIGMAAGLAK